MQLKPSCSQAKLLVKLLEEDCFFGLFWSLTSILPHMILGAEDAGGRLLWSFTSLQPQVTEGAAAPEQARE